MRNTYKFLAILVLNVVLYSCNNIGEMQDNTGGMNINSIIEKAIKDWGVSESYILSSMSGYNQVQGTENDIMQFTAHRGSQSISYYLHDGKLCCTAVIIPAPSSGMDISSVLNGYAYVGDLGYGKVYANYSENTMAIIWTPVEYDSSFNAIGFAPIISDQYENIGPVSVSTDENVHLDIFSAEVSGSVSGIEEEVEAGIIYSVDNNLSEYSEQKVATRASGNFTVTINGLLDQTTYYYCAYAVVDGVCYLGDVKTFDTPEATYVIDGKTYKMILVEGNGVISDFSIMQTELLVNSDIQFGSYNISKLNSNGDIGVISAELKDFLNDLRTTTGIQFRLPTKEEWQYAARGGNRSLGYTYSGSNDIDEVAWYKGNNSLNSSHECALKTPNELGLYDMSGNMAEACLYSESAYHSTDGDICGGSWKDSASACTVSSWKKGDTSTDLIPGTTLREYNSFDARYITIRLIYYRQMN